MVISLVLVSLFAFVFNVSAVDPSLYKDQLFTDVPGDPAFLILCSLSENFFHADGVWGYRISRTGFIKLSINQEQSQLLTKAKENNDIVILLYQRKGKFINFADYGYEPQNQIRFLNDVQRSYSFSVDDIVLYSEILANIPTQIQQTILLEEQADRNNGGWKIYDTFKVTGINGAKSYVQKRVQDIQFANAMLQSAAEQADLDEIARREKEEEKVREEAQTRRQEREAINAQNRILKNGTVHGGYKPCFDSLTEYYALPENFEKLAVFGYIVYSSSQISSHRIALHGSGLAGRSVDVSISGDLRNEIGQYLTERNWSNPCLFFISKTNTKYIVNDYILLADILNKDLHRTYLGELDRIRVFGDDWILQNYDK
jgi:hypothetical protein